MLLSINNFNNIQNEFQADSNSKKYNQSVESFKELGSNTSMITNLDVMQKKLNQLMEKGKISKDEFKYDHLRSLIDGAMRIHVKADKSLNSISEFYETYNNFNDVINQLEGDDK